MAGPYYVDPAASGNNNGSDWTNAWTSLQSALDTVAAGEICYCRGTQTLSAVLDVDQGNSGTPDGGHVKFIGCNAGGTVDGTQFVLNCNSAAASALLIGVATDLWWFENVTFKNSTSYGINASGFACDGWVFVNCRIESNGGAGVQRNRQGFYWSYYQTHIINNGGAGVFKPRQDAFFFCTLSGNSDAGCYDTDGACAFINCIVADNVNYGLRVYPATIYQCVLDGYDSSPVQDNGVEFSGSTTYGFQNLVSSRLTNHTADTGLGLKVGSGLVNVMCCYFGGNDADTSGNYAAIPLYDLTTPARTADSNTMAGSDTNHGYTTTGSDFNLRSDATKRALAVELD